MKKATRLEESGKKAGLLGGLRHNLGKLRFDLFPPDALKACVEILTLGAIKYAPRNWELGMVWSNVTQSLDRHYNAFLMGEDRDQETGKLHLAHMMCNVVFLLVYQIRGIGKDDLPLRHKTKQLSFAERKT